jgi:hypothetical protein
MKQPNNQDYSPLGDANIVMSDTFDLRLFNYQNQFTWNLPTWNYLYSFFVTGLAYDSSNWTSPTISFYLSPVSIDPRNVVPSAPAFSELDEYTDASFIIIRWCNQSPIVDSVRIYYRADGTTEPSIATARANESAISIVNYYPSLSYEFWLTAGNSAGWSPPSESMRLSTHELIPPGDLYAQSSTGGIVYLGWTNNLGWCDTLKISRRDSQSEWTMLRRILPVPNQTLVHSYIDSTATRQHLFFYRIGVTLNSETFWSNDSAGVWVR